MKIKTTITVEKQKIIEPKFSVGDTVQYQYSSDCIYVGTITGMVFSKESYNYCFSIGGDYRLAVQESDLALVQ